MNVLLSPPVGGWSSRNRGAAHTRGRSCIHWVTPVAPRRAAHRGCRRHRALGPAAAKALPVKDCQPSQDLKDLCSLQLGLLQTLLRRNSSDAAGSVGAGLRTSVYVRLPSSAASYGTVLLHRVASLPAVDQPALLPQQGGSREPAAQSGGIQALSTQQPIITLQLTSDGSGSQLSGLPSDALQAFTSPTNSPLGQPSTPLSQPQSRFSESDSALSQSDSALSSSESDSGSPESCLVEEEVLVLPSSGCLVLPLVDGQTLVGLLLAEPSQPPGTHSPADTAAHDSESGHGSAEGVGNGQVDVEGVQQEVPAPLVRHYPGFTDEEVHALRVVAPLLSKACAMELRAAMHLSHASAQTALAARVVRDASRPASALNTFTAMLLPRMEQGSADRDLVQGIAQQGKRLQEVLRHLDSMLSPTLPRALPQPQGSRALTPGTHTAASPTFPAQPTARPTPATRMPHGTAPRRSRPVTAGHVQTVGQAASEVVVVSDVQATAPVQQQALLAQPAGAAARQQLLPAHCQSQAAMGAAHSTDSHPTSEHVASSQPHAPSMHATVQDRPATHASASSVELLTPQTSDDGPGFKQSVSAHVPVVVEGTSVGTPHTPHTRLRPRPVRSAGGVASRKAAGCAQHTDLGSALLAVLTGAARLAAVSGIQFTVQPPLHTAVQPPSPHTQPPRTHPAHPPNTQPSIPLQPTVAASQSAHASGTRARHKGGSSTDVPRLLPRPALPLTVAVTAAMLQRIVGYVLDLALQCTAPGGSLGVSAHAVVAQGVRWIELVITHTGTLVGGITSPTPAIHPALAASTSAALMAASVRPRQASSTRAQDVARTAATAVLEPPTAWPAPTTAPAGAPTTTAALQGVSGSSGFGSGALSLSMAEDMVREVGGWLRYERPVSVSVAGAQEWAGAQQGARYVISLPAPPS